MPIDSKQVDNGQKPVSRPLINQIRTTGYLIKMAQSRKML